MPLDEFFRIRIFEPLGNKPYTYLILLSSKESKQDIVQGLDRAPTII
jgi:hypothetical protein